jgi:hypothetical protein
MNTFLDKLQLYAVPQIGHLQPHTILQQDVAPPHWGLPVLVYLDEKFLGRRIGKRSPIPWHPRSAKITPLDFFMWGYVKSTVYQSPVTGIDELNKRISDDYSR